MQSTEIAATSKTDGSDAERPIRSMARVLSCIRLPEVLALQGSPLIGASLSISSFTAHNSLVLITLALGSFFLVAHIFLLNDWAGIQGDLRAPHRATRAFTTRGVTRAEVGHLALGFLTIGLVLLGSLGLAPLCFALAISGLSSLYSLSVFNLKGVPVAGTVLHLIGGLLHFLLGYATFATLDGRGLAIGCFFGLVFAAGHLMQETRDFEGDRLNRIRTNAVVFGKVQTFVAGMVLFTAAYALLLALALQGSVPRLLGLATFLYPLHLLASLKALQAGLTFASLQRLQKQYWLIYTVIGIMLLITSL